ncbi:prefoldin, alpha subunit [Batrachochytrium salamandrivorans]|nr:prefoldin, alpha subunit [Batrachochytrium salamandrivorans]
MSEPLFVNPQILRYESFVNDRLRKDLMQVLDARDKLYERIAQILQLRNQIQVIQKQPGGNLKSMMNVGCDFFMKAQIPDTSKIILNVGLNVFVEMSLEEAVKFLEIREKQLECQTEKLTSKASEIRAHIKLVLKAIEEVELLDINYAKFLV